MNKMRPYIHGISATPALGRIYEFGIDVHVSMASQLLNGQATIRDGVRGNGCRVYVCVCVAVQYNGHGRERNFCLGRVILLCYIKLFLLIMDCGSGSSQKGATLVVCFKGVGELRKSIARTVLRIAKTTHPQ